MRSESVPTRTGNTLIASLVVLVALATSAAAESSPETRLAAELPATIAFDPATWCRPVVSAAVDPDPLTCWLRPTGGLDESEVSPAEVMLTGTNFGDLPPFSVVEVDIITGLIEEYAERLAREEAERIAAARRADEAAQPRPPATRAPSSTPASGTSPSGDTASPPAEDHCGLRPGDSPTDAQLECMFGPGAPLPIVPIEDDPWEDPGGSDWMDDYSPDIGDPDDFEEVRGYDPLPPAPSFEECPDGWYYDSRTGYRCL